MAIEQIIHFIKQGQGIPSSLMRMHFEEADLIRKRSCLAYIINNRSTLNNETILSLIYKSERPAVTTQAKMMDKANQCNTWTTVVGKNQCKAPDSQYKKQTFNIPCSNKFGVLSKYSETNVEINNKATECKYVNKSKMNQRPKKQVKFNFNKKAEIMIYSDIQGRNLSKIIRECSNENVKAFGCVMPNATAKQVLSQAVKAVKGPVVIIPGTNNILKNNLEEIYKELEESLKLLSQSKQVLIATIPKRFDIPENNREHFEQIKLNNYIEELAVRINNTYILNLEILRRYHFSQKGLHLNQRGKKKLSYMILDKLNNMKPFIPHVPDAASPAGPSNVLSLGDFPPLSPPELVSQTTLSSPLKNPKPATKLTSNSIPVTPNIQIINTDMKEVITKFNGDKSVAFAHCISADFGHKKQMSQGVVSEKNSENPPSPICVTSTLHLNK